MRRVKIRETGPLALEMTVRKTVKKKRKTVTERLAIEDPAYPRTDESRILFQSFGVMHLVAPYLPREIDTDFPVSDLVAELIDDMYASCGEKPPGYVGKIGTGDIIEARFGGMEKNDRAIVAYSAGKDSLWNMMWASKQYGMSNVMAVHVDGLNPSCSSGEREWALRQADRLGFSHYRSIRLRNGSKCSKTGFQMMRSRDLFLTGMLVPVARQFAADVIITEGFAETLDDEPFTGQQATMERMNALLHKMGIPVQIKWSNLPEMDVIRELYEQKPEWMPEVHNCFAMPCYKIGIARSWLKRAPTFPMYESQCGSCVKCRIVNIARMRYDQTIIADTSEKDKRYYLQNTVAWIRKKHGTHHDMIQGSFMRDLLFLLRANRMRDQIPKIPESLEAA